MRKTPSYLLAACVLGSLTVPAEPARAQRHDDFHGGDFHRGGFHGDFHGRDFHGFSPFERRAWSGGHWVNGWHDGRFAWWWLADGGWYFYPAPVYPYPTYVPPAIVVQRPPPQPTGLPPAQSWYYCDNPRGYYPYVASCGGAWREVPVAPATAPVQPPPQPSATAR